MSNIINLQNYINYNDTHKIRERLSDKIMKNLNPNEVINEIRNDESLRSNIQECAEKVLNAFKIDASKGYVPIVSILTSLGIKTYKRKMTTSKLSAYISVDPDYYDSFGTMKIACVNEDDPPGHMRFALAHELAHYIFDYNEAEDIRFYNTYIKDSLDKDDSEDRANEFAANLLMPKGVFIKKMEQLKKETNSKPDLIVKLAEHFAVSTNSIIKRIDEVNRG